VATSPALRLYREHRVLFWVCVLIFTNQIGFGAIVPVVPLYALSFDVSNSAIGVTIAVFGLARFFFSVPSGQLADRIGRRRALAFGSLFTLVGNLLCALAPSYIPFLIARFIAGIGASFVITLCQIVLADITTSERRGRMMSVYMGTFMFAVGIGPLPGGLLAEHYGLAAPFVAFAALGGVASLLAWFLLPETKGMQGGRRVTIPLEAPPFLQQLRIMTASRGFLLISVISFTQTFARTGGLFNLVPVLGKERLELSVDQIGLGLSIMSVCALVLSYPSGWMTDRFGRKKVIVPSTFITAAAFVVFPLAPDYLWFILGCMTWATASGISGAAQPSYAADTAPSGMNAAAMSAYRSFADLGYVVGPILIGFAADVLSLDHAFAVTSLLVLISALTFWRWAPESYRPGMHAAR
jgi:multidrug resistance protein